MLESYQIGGHLKNLVFILVVIASIDASAQTKRTIKKTAPANSSSSNEMSLDDFSSQELTGKLGFSAQALHIGVDYNKMIDGAGIGGYFFYQTSKKSGAATITNQVMSLGASYKMNFVDNNKMIAYVSPGFGIHMIKEIGASSTGTASDETVLGPAYKIGTQLKINSTLAIGLERSALVNWLSDKVTGGEFVYYSVAGTFWF